jgi:hypothetical protein
VAVVVEVEVDEDKVVDQEALVEVWAEVWAAVVLEMDLMVLVWA